jgi:hypothetical protein
MNVLTHLLGFRTSILVKCRGWALGLMSSNGFFGFLLETMIFSSTSVLLTCR